MNFVDRTYIAARNRWNKFVEEFKNDESGVSSVVATVLLILIVVVLAGVLMGFLTGFFNDIFDKIFNAGQDIEDTSGFTNPYS